MNVKQISIFGLKVLFTAVIIALALFFLGLVAVSLWFLTYNAPIVPTCPVAEGSSTVSALDSDGIVSNVFISDGAVPGIELMEITPATTEGGVLTAQVTVFETVPEDSYRLKLIFINDDTIPQTANCRLDVKVVKAVTDSGAINTYYSIERRGRAAKLEDYAQAIARKPFLAIIPGFIVVALTFFAAVRFVKRFYDLSSYGLALRLIAYQIFGRPSSKKPYISVAKGGLLDGGDEVLLKVGGPGNIFLRKDNANAVVLEQKGKLTRVAIGPCFPPPTLEPYERIWDVIDMRPQRWVYTVAAITYDGIPIEYEADVQFQVKHTKDDVFKAATCKWIRDANRSEPDRLMIWTKRVVIGAMEGTLRKLLARRNLDELLDVETRRQVQQELREALTGSAANFGVRLIDVTLRNIEFQGKVLDQWFEEWQARRDREVQRVKAQGEAQRIKAREQASSIVRQAMLAQTRDIFNHMADNNPDAAEQFTEDFIVLSFVEMIRRTAINKPLYMPNNIMQSLESLRSNLHARREEDDEESNNNEPDNGNEA